MVPHEHSVSWSLVFFLCLLTNCHGGQWVVVKLVLPTVHGVFARDDVHHLGARHFGGRVLSHLIPILLTEDSVRETFSFAVGAAAAIGGVILGLDRSGRSQFFWHPNFVASSVFGHDCTMKKF